MSRKEERRQLIKLSAKELFIEKNIETTTFAQIAKAAGVGEATVYRHYSNKGVIALDVAMDYATDYVTALSEKIRRHEGSHLEKFELVLDYYIELFLQKPDYLIYLEHFDNFITHVQEAPEGFEKYEEQFHRINKVICDIEAGEMPDDSVRKDIDIDLSTYTYNISYLSLCQKLLLRGSVLHEDQRHDALKALELMKQVMIDSIRQQL